MKKKVIIVNNLNKYQHYKDRNIIWIKLYVDILQDYKFSQLDDNERWIFIGLILLAVKNDNKIPADFPYICQVISNSKKNISKTILKLQDFELISIKSLASCYQDAILEERRGDKRRGEAFNKNYERPFPYKDAKEIIKDKLADK